MLQKLTQQFASECQKAIIHVDNDMPIGAFHDFLMEIKGLMVNRMIAAHKEHEEESKAQQQFPPHQSEIDALPDQSSCANDSCTAKE